MQKKLHVKVGDKVQVISGESKGQEGAIIGIDRDKLRATVEGLNMIKKHVKTTKEKKGGIISKENFINITNLAVIVDTKNTKKKEVKK